MRIRPFSLVMLCVFVTFGCGGKQRHFARDQRTIITSHDRAEKSWAGVLARPLTNPQLHDLQPIPDSWNGDYGLGAMLEVVPIRDLSADDDNTFMNVWKEVAILSVSAANEGDFPIGDNCVWVTFDGNWKGALTAYDKPNKKCAPVTGNPKAKLERTALAGRTYPPGVRLHYNQKGASDNYTLYVGVRCSSGWCYISNKQQPKVRPVAGTTDQELIPGWHDDQFLAYVDANNQLTRSDIWGKVTPEPSLKDEKFPEGDPTVKVATITTDGSAPDYARQKFLQRWGYDPVSVQMVDVYLRRVQDSTFEVELRNGASLISRTTVKQKFHHHDGPTPTRFDILGTARFGWSPDGEDVWVRCDDGCCTVT